MTRIEDINAAADAGADSIGLNFYPPSPRFVEIEKAAELAYAVPHGPSIVALFVNPDVGFVREVLAETKPQFIQFHGDESPEFCQQFNTRYIKALRVRDQNALEQQWQIHAEADFMLLDAFVPGTPGGTGEQFDWSIIREEMTDRLFLAGGLTPENVYAAVDQIRPYAVDVAGGIEESKGIKSASKMRYFADEVRRADALFNEKSS
jgi:phosphoribosylanthranilate isomerase